MRQTQLIKRKPRNPTPTDLDLRTPSGRQLPF
jgi:hypothetical protein